MPLGQAVTWVSTYLNVLQFLAIRRYLGFVFILLILLLMALALWQ